MLIELNKAEAKAAITTLQVTAIEIITTAKNTAIENDTYEADFQAEYLLQKARELLFLKRTIRRALTEQTKEDK